jgi:hypothetical protein
VTDQLRDVEGETFLLVAAKEFLDRDPGKVHAGRNVEGETPHILSELGGHGSGREPAIAHDLRGDALADLGLGAPIAEEPPVGMRVHVDEAGRHHETRGVQGLPRGLAREITHRRDALAGDADIRAHRRRPRSVEDVSARDLEVKHAARP